MLTAIEAAEVLAVSDRIADSGIDAHTVVRLYEDWYWCQAFKEMWVSVNPGPRAPTVGSISDAWEHVLSMVGDPYAGLPLGFDSLGAVLFACASEVAEPTPNTTASGFFIDVDLNVWGRACRGLCEVANPGGDSFLFDHDLYWSYPRQYRSISALSPEEPVVQSITDSWRTAQCFADGGCVDESMAAIRFADVLWGIGTSVFNF